MADLTKPRRDGKQGIPESSHVQSKYATPDPDWLNLVLFIPFLVMEHMQDIKNIDLRTGANGGETGLLLGCPLLRAYL